MAKVILSVLFVAAFLAVMIGLGSLSKPEEQDPEVAALNHKLMALHKGDIIIHRGVISYVVSEPRDVDDVLIVDCVGCSLFDADFPADISTLMKDTFVHTNDPSYKLTLQKFLEQPYTGFLSK